MTRLLLAALASGCLLALSSTARSHSQSLLIDTLNEAQSYLTVLPEKSLALLSSFDNVKHLTAKQQVNWYSTKASAAIQLSDLPMMEHSLEQIISLNQATRMKLDDAVINQLGVWFRRSGYLEQAKYSYVCILEDTQDSLTRLKALSNLAVVERNSGNLQLSQKINTTALTIAKLQREKSMESTIENNLGILALQQNNAKQASIHFRSALDINHKILRRSGEILNGINLLFSFIKGDEYEMYARFHPRLVRKMQAHPSDARAAYLNWIHQTYLYRATAKISQKQISQLKKDYDAVNDIGIQQLLLPFAIEMNIDVNPTDRQPNKHYTGDWLERIEQCNWHKDQSVNYAKLIETVYPSIKADI